MQIIIIRCMTCGKQGWFETEESEQSFRSAHLELNHFNFVIQYVDRSTIPSTVQIEH